MILSALPALVPLTFDRLRPGVSFPDAVPLRDTVSAVVDYRSRQPDFDPTLGVSHER
jgi:hypothetical protein